jgi:hypothetical protein
MELKRILDITSLHRYDFIYLRMGKYIRTLAKLGMDGSLLTLRPRF